MTRRQTFPHCDRRDIWAAVLVLAAIVVVVGMLTACQTYAAVTAAPVEFWLTAEEILGAFWLDILWVVELFL